MQKEKEDKEKEKAKGKRRKPYQKPALTEEKLFEATVLACGKVFPLGECKDLGKNKSQQKREASFGEYWQLGDFFSQAYRNLGTANNAEQVSALTLVSWSKNCTGKTALMIASY